MDEIKENEAAIVPEAAPAPAPAPAPSLQRIDFNDMPGVSLTLPDKCSPADMVRIVAKIQERIGLHAIQRVAALALGV